MFNITDVKPDDLRMDYHVGEKHISMELHHALDYADGTGGDRMDIHRVLFIEIATDRANADAAENLAMAMCAAVNDSPELMANFKAFAMVSPG